MENKKVVRPLGLKVALWLYWLKFVLMMVALAAFQYAVSIKTHSSPIFSEIQSKLYEHLKMNPVDDAAYNSGLIIGHFLIPFLLTFVALFLLHGKKYHTALLILVGLISVQSIAAGIIPLISIIVFSLLLTQPVGIYFGKDLTAKHDILDDGTAK